MTDHKGDVVAKFAAISCGARLISAAELLRHDGTADGLGRLGQPKQLISIDQLLAGSNWTTGRGRAAAGPTGRGAAQNALRCSHQHDDAPARLGVNDDARRLSAGGQARFETCAICTGHVTERKAGPSQRLDAGGDQTKNEWIESRR